MAGQEWLCPRAFYRAIAERVRMHPWDTQLHLDALREIQTRTAPRGALGAEQKREAVASGMAEVALRLAEQAWPPEVAGTGTPVEATDAQLAKAAADLRCRGLSLLMQIATEPSCRGRLLPAASRIVALLRGCGGAHGGADAGAAAHIEGGPTSSDAHAAGGDSGIERRAAQPGPPPSRRRDPFL